MKTEQEKSKNGFMEIFLIAMILFNFFIIMPVIISKIFLQNQAQSDVNKVNKLLLNINTYKKTNDLGKMDFNRLYEKNLIPKEMLTENKKDKSYISVNAFGREIHLSEKNKSLSVISTTYSRGYCYNYLRGFIESGAKDIKINDVIIKDESGLDNCKNNLNIIEILI